MRIFVLAICLLSVACTEPLQPPVTERRPVETTMFGDTRTDPYAWLRDRDDPAVIEHLKRENAYTDALLESQIPLRDALHAEMVARVPERELLPPEPDGEWSYSRKETAALEYPVYLRQPIAGGAEQVVLDLNVLAEEHEYYGIPKHAVSPDGQVVAYLEDTNGDDVAALRLRAIDGTMDREIHAEELSAYALAWSANGDTLYYTRPDATQRPSEVWRHRLGTDPGTDVMILREDNGSYWVDLVTSRSGEAIFIHAMADDSSRIHYLDANNSNAGPKEIVPLREGVRVVEICHRPSDAHAGWFYAVDDGDGARDGRLVRTRVDAELDEPWEVVVPEIDGVQIRTFAVIRDWFVFEERRDGQRVVRVVRHDGSDEHIVPLTPAPGYASFDLGPEYDRDTIRIVSSGLLAPFAVHEYNPQTRTAETLFERETAFDTNRFESSMLYGVASDGTKIPVTYIRPRDAAKDGSTPTVLTGYGAYGVILEPGEHMAREYASLLDRGFAFAVAHPRGGGFYGQRWHDAARRETHGLTYSDFVAASEALIQAGLTKPERLAWVGGSAGGLLVAAAANLRPDMARVVVADVPFVDCLNSMLDPTIPVTTLDYPEYGNPAEERHYRAIRSFAPYENVRDADYPDIMAISGINDSRAAFWESAKWVARLRERRTDKDGLTLLRMNLGAGHGGPSRRTDALLESAEWQAFILERLGLGSSM